MLAKSVEGPNVRQVEVLDGASAATLFSLRAGVETIMESSRKIWETIL